MYRIQTRVKALERKHRTVRTWVDNTDPEKPEIKSQCEDMGWFITFDNSHESLFVGYAQPIDLKVGQAVDVYIVPKRGT